MQENHRATIRRSDVDVADLEHAGVDLFQLAE